MVALDTRTTDPQRGSVECVLVSLMRNLCKLLYSSEMLGFTCCYSNNQPKPVPNMCMACGIIARHNHYSTYNTVTIKASYYRILKMTCTALDTGTGSLY